MTRLVRWTVALIGVLSSAAWLAAAAAPAADADPIGSCTATVGTIIAVDYGHWGGPIVRGCGVNDASGYTLLHAGGFTTAGDNHDGPAFICRIGNQAFHSGAQYPTPKQDPCIVTPPASAYWSYWLAPAGQNTWSYSQLGAMSEVPKPGEVEFWEFGGTNIAGTTGSGVPTVSPDSLRAPNTKPVAATAATPSSTPTARHTATTHSSASAGIGSTPHPATTITHSSLAAATPSSTPTSSRHRHRHRPRATAPATSASSPAASPGPGESKQPTIVNAQPAAQVRASHGSAVGLIVGVVIALLFAGGAGWSVWQRRRHSP